MKIMLKRIGIVLVLSLTLRLTFFLFQASWDPVILEKKIMPMGTDQRGYHQLAVTLLEHKKLSFKPELPPVVLRTPGYPVFIAATYYIFGKQPWIVILLQNLIDPFTAILILIIFSKLIDPKIGLISGILYSIEPHIIMYTNTFYSDSLFIFMLSLFLFFLTEFILNSGKNVNIIIASVLLGLAVLVKPAAAYLPFLIVIPLLFKFKKEYKQVIKYSFTFLIFYFITISPWLIRNYIHYGKIFLSNSGEYNLLAINITPMEIPKRNKPQYIVEKELRDEADSLMLADGIKPFWNEKPKDYWEELNLQQDINKTEYWKRTAIKYINQDPVSFTKHYFIGILHSFLNVASAGFAESLNLTSKGRSINLKSETDFINLIKRFFIEKSLPEIIFGILIGIYLFLIYFSLIMGLIKLKDYNNKNILYAYFLFSIYFILIAGAGGLARFRLPAVPFYIGISGLGLFEIIKYSLRKFNIRFFQ